MDNTQIIEKSSPQINITKKNIKERTRCPNGTRKNPKTKECEPIRNKNNIQPQQSPQQQQSQQQQSQQQQSPQQQSQQQSQQQQSQQQQSQQQQSQSQQSQQQQSQSQQQQSQQQQSQQSQQSQQQSQQSQQQSQQQSVLSPPPSSIETVVSPEQIQETDPNKIRNKKLNEIELRDRNELLKPNDYDFLYPSLNDSNFNIKIAERKEFNDTKYDGSIITDIEKHSNELCNSEFELSPHQLFVRNFLSFQTPYNSLLLYHGLGSGKTCSAISVAEEMRDYMINMGITSQIMIVASPNVQTNFKIQLFDERKLKLVNGLWNLRSCTGNKFLKEINPMNMKGLTKENVIKQIKKIIDTYYYFFGYVEFANYISRKSNLDDIEIKNENHKNNVIKNKLRKVFNNRLIVIDECHNIRISDDNKDKRVSDEILKLVKNVNNLRLLLLSGTPMFNSYKEIIWLINIMNINDGRSTIDVKDVFNKDGSFKVSSSGKEIGKELLERKATGYISVVRGENPYTFPYRIWPSDFSKENTFSVKTYPTIQINGVSALEQKIHHLPLYLTNIGEYQEKGYKYIIQRLKNDYINKQKEMPNIENLETFGYTMLQQPLEALNIIYPHDDLDKDNNNFNSIELVGGEGLKRIMNFNVDPNTYFRSNFDYKPEIIKKYGRIFSPNKIGNYSSKIKTICNHIINSKGVILIYSQYIDAGLVPIALALEEIGFSRAGNTKSLFSSNPTKKVKGLNYVMITGDKGFSTNPAEDIKLSTNDNNINGDEVKVILISQTGTEGLDLKFIRQVHVLEPWYNLNRIEQIFGRAIRTCSHKLLPFNERNVELYLYASLLNENASEETADLYIYRLAELKSIQIGKVTRLLKENSIDCILNSGQTNFTEENMELNGVKPVTLKLSSGGTLENYKIGDKPYSSICDYMENCEYTCRPNKEITEDDINTSSYTEDFIMNNNDKIIHRIKQLMKERFFYNKRDLVSLLNSVKVYPIIQINASLQQLIEDKNEFISDKYNRMGNLINIDDLYLFQPLEINDERISLFDRSTPLDVKHSKIIMKLPEIQQQKDIIFKNIEKKTKYINDDDIKKLITTIKEKYNFSINKKDILLKSEKNWYLLSNKAIEYIKDIKLSMIKYLITQHIVDELNLKEILIILNEIYDNPNSNEKYNNELFDNIKRYIKTKIVIGKGNIKGIIWNDKSIKVIIVKNINNELDNQWHIAESEDEKDLKDALEIKREQFMNNLNNDIGFMSNFKKEDTIVFKTKNMLNERDLGARCDQHSTKEKGLSVLNRIIGNQKYSSELDLKLICIIQELYFRLFDEEGKNEKKWFLSPGESLLTNIDKKIKTGKKYKPNK